MQSRVSLALVTLLAATYVPSIAVAVEAPREIDFVLTAYYSPLPGQCCYVKGGLTADKILNGNGTNGADGTPVYVGMLAAPPSYAFGTRVALPGLGVLEVHDRGGAIQELEGGTVHRLDVWAGHGEEGLARALSFGVQRIRGTVYPPGSDAPAADFSLDRIAIDYERLRQYNVVQNGLIDLQPKLNETSLSVAHLQDHLHALGYLSSAPTRFFGPETQSALESFQRDQGLSIDGTALSAHTAAALMAAVRVQSRDMRVPLVHAESTKGDIASAQRLLRSMKYYRGRTNGQYTDALRSAIIAFQKDHALIGDEQSPGAGTIGPMTQAAIERVLRNDRSKDIARGIVLLKRVRDRLAERHELVAATVQEGYTGDAVKDIQHVLATLGFFPADAVNGVFGPLTRESVAEYQLARGVVSTSSQQGAGTVGPKTLKALQQEQIDHAYSIVRGYGFNAL